MWKCKKSEAQWLSTKTVSLCSGRNKVAADDSQENSTVLNLFSSVDKYFVNVTPQHPLVCQRKQKLQEEQDVAFARKLT